MPLLIRRPWGILLLVIVGALYFAGQLDGKFGSPKDDATKGATRVTSADTNKEVSFVSFVLDDAQTTWTKLFADSGKTYDRAKLVLFTNATQTGCGGGRAASGPFYCPADERVYIDLGFYDELAQRFGARGDFAQAYVIAHEIGHHVQHQLGTDARVQQMARSEQRGATGGSVRLELQADCYAGVWAKSTSQRNLLDPGDIEEALGAAASIGDDRLQREASGRVHPESWTHGSSDQRARWFRRGYEEGKPQACDTFSAREP